MKKTMKRLGSAVLVLALLVSAVPVQVLAASDRAMMEPSSPAGARSAASVTFDLALEDIDSDIELPLREPDKEEPRKEEREPEAQAETAMPEVPSAEVSAIGGDPGNTAASGVNSVSISGETALGEEALLAASVKYGSISGKTATGEGAPLAGVSVQIYSVKEEAFYYVTSDENGLWQSPEYELIAEYAYVVNYYKAGYTFAENDVHCTATEAGTVLEDAVAVGLEIEAVTNIDDYSFQQQGEGYYITGYSGADEIILLPAYYDGKPVTGISGKWSNNTSVKTVLCSENITTIDQAAFYQWVSLETIYFPNTLVSIGYGAFEGCEELTDLEFPFGLTQINSNAFKDCLALTAANLPDTVESIHHGAFMNSGIGSFHYPLKWEKAGTSVFGDCRSLKEITVPEGVTVIPEDAFYGANFLERINLPSSLTTIDREAFYNCVSLTGVEFPDGLTTINYAAFRGCVSFTKLDLPDSVTYLGQNAFAACTGVESLHYPLKLSGSGNAVFYGCNNLTSVTVPEGVTEIPYGLFQDSSLISVSLPSTLKTISDYAFKDCAALQDPDFPDRLEKIGNNAFEGCTSLTRMELPDSVTAILSWAFVGCTNLEYCHYPKSLATVGQAIWGAENKIKSIEVPEGVTVIPKWAFLGLTTLKSVTFPSTLTEIGDEAFYGCTGIKILEFPDALQKVGTEAFRNCSSLITAELPDGVTFIGQAAFNGCTALEYFRFPLKLESANGILQGCPKITEIEIPEGVTAIPAWIFSSMTSLKTVSVPSTLKSIGGYAFQKCTALEGFEFPDGLELIDYDAFSGCTALTEAILPDSVTTIRGEAFGGCENLRYINYPLNLKAAGAYIFSGCPKLTSMTVPEGVTALPDYVFCGAPFRTISLPSTLTAVGYETFENCASLRLIDLPASVTQIGKDAFYGCKKLEYVTIPAMKCSIHYSAFDNCDAVIRCKENSDAMLYAFNYSKLFELIAFDEGDLDRLVIDMDDSAFYSVGDTAIATDYVPMTLRYKLNDGVSPTNMKLSVTFTKNTYLNERDGAVTLDGKTVESYDYSGNTLTVPVTESEGVLRFSVLPYEAGVIAAYASFSYKLDGNDSKDIIGLVYLDVPVITLSLPQFTSEKTVVANGITTSGGELVFKLGDTEIGTAKAKRDGTYSAALTLPGTPEDGQTFTITAGQKDDETVSTTGTVTYNEAAPRATKFEMYYLSSPPKYVDLLAVDGSRYTFSFASGCEYRFVIQFENYEKLGDVIVTNTRSGVTEKLKAEPTGVPGEYVAQGRFGPDAFLPGTIELKYTTVVELEDVKTDLTMDDLSDYWQNARMEIHVDEEDYFDGDIVFEDGDSIRLTVKNNVTVGALYEEFLGVEAPAQTNEIRSGSGAAEDALGSFLEDVAVQYIGNMFTNYENIAVFEDDQLGAIKYVVWDSGESAVSEVVVQYGTAAGAYGTGKLFGAQNFAFSDAATGVGVAMEEYEAAIHCGKNYVKLNDAAERIKGSNRSSAEKSQALAGVNGLMFGYTAVNAGRLVAPVAGAILGTKVGAALGTVFGPAGTFCGALAGAAFGYITGELLDFGEWVLDEILDYFTYGRGVSMRVIIDPSGYVYDSRTDKPLEGVTVTAYWIEYDPYGFETAEAEQAYWSRTIPDDEYGTLWDASEYSQINPIITDETGEYAWDVPEGWWRVKYEKDGYAAVWSDWMTVPPVRTDVNIPLVSMNSEEYAISTANEAEGSVTLAIEGCGENDENVQCVIAAYDRSGRMLICITDAVSATADEAAEVVFDYAGIEGITYLKAFLIDGANGEPLCESWYHTIHA